jgi:hypothetical protein
MRLYQRAAVAAAVCLTAGTAAAQTLVYDNTFTSSIQAPGGTLSAVNRDQAGSDPVTLGVFSALGQQSLSLSSRTFWDQLVTLSLDPSFSYSGGSVSFRIYIWDTCDGINCCGPDRVGFNINNGPLLMNDFFVDRAPDDAVNGRRGYDYTFNFGALGAGPQFNWVGDPTQTDEGWTLDNVQVRLDLTAVNTTVPEPGTWALLGTGLLAIGGVSVRRKRAS